jgi:hypothetical protein
MKGPIAAPIFVSTPPFIQTSAGSRLFQRNTGGMSRIRNNIAVAPYIQQFLSPAINTA